MKTLPVVLGLCLLASGLHAFAPHPTVLTVKYKDEMQPVVHIDGTNPVIVVNGKEKIIRSGPVYALERSGNYRPGNVHFVTRPTAAGTIWEGTAGTMAATTGSPDFIEMTLKSDVLLRHVFVVIVGFYYDTKSGLIDNSEEVIVPHEAPDLPAGQDILLRFSSRGWLMGHFFFVQVFSEGVEVRTDETPLASTYYSIIERSKLAHLVDNLRKKNSGKDLDPFPLVRVKPLLPEGVAIPAEPVKATFTITAEGLVTNVSLQGNIDPVVETAVRDALDGWLFLPKFKAGQPVAARVQLPLLF